MQDNRNTFFQGEAPGLSYSSNNAAPSVKLQFDKPTFEGFATPASLWSSSREPYNLGGNLQFDRPTFEGFTTPASFEPKVREPVGVVGATTRALLKSELTRDAFPVQQEKWLPAMGYVGTTVSAAKIGQTISNTISDNQADGQSGAEASICGVLKVMSKEVPEKIAKGFIVGGIPPYLAASIGNPALAATLPVVLPLIPLAYQGAEVIAQKISSYVDDVCHAQFHP